MPPNDLSTPLSLARPLRAAGLFVAAALLTGTAGCASFGSAQAGTHRYAAPADCQQHDAGLRGDDPVARFRGARLDEVTRAAGWLYAGSAAPCGSGWLDALAHLAADPLARGTVNLADAAVAPTQAVGR